MSRDKSIPSAPVGAPRHRRWRVWYDFGLIEAGSCVIETGWYAKGPGGDVIIAADWNSILAGVDTVEDGLGLERGERLPLIVHKPPREAGAFTFWHPASRRLAD